MEILYQLVIVLATALLSGIVSGRIAYFLAKKKWEFKSNDDTEWFVGFTACVAAALMACANYAVICQYGILAGVIGAAAAIPAIGFIWVFLIGCSKAAEKILVGLLSKVG